MKPNLSKAQKYARKRNDNLSIKSFEDYYTRFKACNRKTSYVSERMANIAIDEQMQTYGAKQLYAYKCEHCKKYHLTSRPRNLQ